MSSRNSKKNHMVDIRTNLATIATILVAATTKIGYEKSHLRYSDTSYYFRCAIIVQGALTLGGALLSMFCFVRAYKKGFRPAFPNGVPLGATLSVLLFVVVCMGRTWEHIYEPVNWFTVATAMAFLVTDITIAKTLGFFIRYTHGR